MPCLPRVARRPALRALLLACLLPACSGGGSSGDSLGSACKQGSDCTTNLCLFMALPGTGSAEKFPGGYCTSSCTKDSDCGSAAGLQNRCAGGACHLGCRTTADCGRPYEPYVCDPAGRYCLSGSMAVDAAFAPPDGAPLDAPHGDSHGA